MKAIPAVKPHLSLVPSTPSPSPSFALLRSPLLPRMPVWLLLILRAAGHWLAEGHFMTTLERSSPISHSPPQPCLFPAGHVGTT